MLAIRTVLIAMNSCPRLDPDGRSPCMRYGVIRISPELPPAHVQRRLIEMTGYDVILEERASTPAGRKILMQLLQGLKAGDEVIVHSLESFDASLGDLVRLLSRFHEADVTLRLVGGAQVENLAPRGPMPTALALLARHEARHPTPPPTRRRARSNPAPLTTHQVQFARDMRRRGHSMRAIGLVFQLSPEEVTALIGRDPGPSETVAESPSVSGARRHAADG